jgi:hypothetical protein
LVLKPGGTFCVMVYNKDSINYHVEIMFLRKLLRTILLRSFMPQLLSRLTGFEQTKLERHRGIMLSTASMTKEKWISINTDGPDCPLAKVYTAEQARSLFRKFKDVHTEAWFFDHTHWSFIGKATPRTLRNWLGRKWGWHRMVYGRKA